jgi:hypothetical protein
MMKSTMRSLLFFILPLIAVLSYPPDTLLGNAGVLVFALVFFGLLGFLLWRGYHLALTFSIFLQGFNVIIRLMMFFSNSFSNHNVPDFIYIITSLIGLILSGWLLFRLDRDDVRITMVR